MKGLMRSASRSLLLAALLCSASALLAQSASTWVAWAGNSEAMIVYGEPDSDVLWFGMSCDVRTGEVTISRYLDITSLKEGDKGPIKLSGAGGIIELQGTTTELDTGNLVLEAKAPRGKPILAPLSKPGSLVIEVPGSSLTIPLGSAAAQGLAIFKSKFPGANE